MGVFGGDYIGFSYNGVHSSELGIMRVSDGSRYNENLLPTSKDITVQVPGGDGTYYFGSYYTQRSFTISYAFDGLRENQLEFIKEFFGDKKIHPLVFDEHPYKIYYAKVASTTSIKYIPFSENDQRIFKGEGSLQFICYNPFAVCEKKFLKEYLGTDNSEWADASNLLYSEFLKDGRVLNQCANGMIPVYNPGVKATDWRMCISANQNYFDSLEIKLDDKQLIFSGCAPKGQDAYLVFDSKIQMVKGLYHNGEKFVESGNLYNEYISAGDFFDIPVTIEKKIDANKLLTKDMELIGENVDSIFVSLNYNYYYY